MPWALGSAAPQPGAVAQNGTQLLLMVSKNTCRRAAWTSQHHRTVSGHGLCSELLCLGPWSNESPSDLTKAQAAS